MALKNKIILLFSLFALLSCKGIQNKTTTIEIVDNNRHYYPITQGQLLEIRFDIKNTGKNPFILHSLITSCGCLRQKRSSINSIPAGKEGRLILEYNSDKNIGKVEHFIMLYGNFSDTNLIELKFDVNVVPDAHYTKDYEELYRERMEKSGGIKEFVEGKANNKGYYMDEDFYH